MVDNEPEEPGDRELDADGVVVGESGERAPPVSSHPMASAGISFPGGRTANESFVIFHIVWGVGLRAFQVSGDVNAMENALAYHLPDVHPPKDVEGLKLYSSILVSLRLSH